jgi:hypothetical protein
MGLVALLPVVLATFSGASAVVAKKPQVSYVVAGKGRIGSSRWQAWLEGVPRHRSAKHAVCLSIALGHSGRNSGVSESYECGPVSDRIPAIAAVTAGSGRRERSVFLAVFGSATRKVVVDLGSRGPRSFKIKRLSDQKAKQIGTDAVAYWAQGFAGPVCLRQITSYSGNGQMLSDSGVMPCGANRAGR